MIIAFIFVLSLLSSYTTYGQQCQGMHTIDLNGQCSSVNNCQGTVLASNSCGENKCCINGTPMPSTFSCINATDFNILYNTTRATFLQQFLNYGIYLAGICDNCQAKAAFLAVAATMTNNFQTDEAIGSTAEFTKDDTSHGNYQTGDGSKFRRRGFFGLRGREIYTRLQIQYPQYQTLSNPESAALLENSAVIASLLWKNSNLQNGNTQIYDHTNEIV